jgi:hypothetical protein
MKCIHSVTIPVTREKTSCNKPAAELYSKAVSTTRSQACYKLVKPTACEQDVRLLHGFTRKNAQVVTDVQTSCNKVVVKPLTFSIMKLLSPCYKVDDGNRLATSCSNKIN